MTLDEQQQDRLKARLEAAVKAYGLTQGMKLAVSDVQLGSRYDGAVIAQLAIDEEKEETKANEP